jgi:hypothetical protein
MPKAASATASHCRAGSLSRSQAAPPTATTAGRVARISPASSAVVSLSPASSATLYSTVPKAACSARFQSVCRSSTTRPSIARANGQSTTTASAQRRPRIIATGRLSASSFATATFAPTSAIESASWR